MHKIKNNNMINSTNNINISSGGYYDNVTIFIDKFIKNYLININFINTGNIGDDEVNIKELLMKDIIKIYTKCYKNINILIKNLNNSKKNISLTENTNRWKQCCNKCYNVLHKCINKEINTTAFILKSISDSIISAKSHPTNLVLSVKNLTGNWQNDKHNITIISYGSVTLSDSVGKLIIGAGPSASGKTYWANNIINLFSELENFPKSFISIDGGLYRSTSLLYNIITYYTHIYNVYGIKNLVSTGIIDSTNKICDELFDSNYIKNIIKNFLQSQTIIKNLYVPDTLRNHNAIKLKQFINEYKHITNDSNWICIHIWQHKFRKHCNKSHKYKCYGCTESGKKREKKEGKIYSNYYWDKSYKNGVNICNMCPSGYINIHNTGGMKYLNKATISTISTICISDNIDLSLKNIIEHPANMIKYNYTCISANN